MPLDPQAQSLVDAMAKLNLKPIEDSTPEEARESMRSRTAGLGPFEEVAAVTEHRVPVTGGEIIARLYAPAGPGPHPALVFYHGGGWVIGDLYTHDGICRSLTNAAGCIVASVDYRLAPESRYPVAAWLNRLPPPADEIVFDPVAPLKAAVLPSALRPA